MALATYSDLQAAVAGYIERTDLTNPIKDAIALCEARILYGGRGSLPSEPLRVRAMEASASLIVQQNQGGGTTAGSVNALTIALTGFTRSVGATVTATIGSGLTNTSATTLNIESTGVVAVRRGPDSAPLTGGELVAGTTATFYDDGTYYQLLPYPGVPLPSGWLGARRLFLNSDPRQQMEYLPPPDFYDRQGSTQTGQPRFYTIESDTIILGPISDSTRVLKALYWKRFPALSDTVTTNWLLTNAPNVYLYGTLMEIALYEMNDARAGQMHGLYLSACNGLGAANEMDRFAGAPLQMRPDVNPLPNFRGYRQA